MHTIYRIEYTDGRGIWRAKIDEEDYVWETLSFKKDLENKHWDIPNPYEDRNILRPPLRTEYFAFESIEQMNFWIEQSWYKELIEVGFKILAININEIIIGEYQVLFKKTDIISITDISNSFLI
jgi:hypothetical protein